MNRFWLFCFLCFPGNLLAQMLDYGQEWYVSDTSRSFIKLLVAEDGLYRLHATDLLTAGFPVTGIPAVNWHLYSRGKEVPVQVVAKVNGELNYLDFWGERNDGAVDSLMYRDAITGLPATDLQPDPAFSLFTDSAAYFLTWDNTPGLRYQSHYSSNLNGFPLSTEFPYSSDLTYEPTSLQADYSLGGGGAYDVFYKLNSDYGVGEGYVGPEFTHNDSLVLDVPTPLAIPGTPVSLHCRVFGKSYSQHALQVSVNQTLLLDTTWNTSQVYLKSYVRSFMPAGGLPATSQVLLEAVGPNTDDNHLCRLGLRYMRESKLGNLSEINISQWQSPDTVCIQFTQVLGVDSAWIYDPVHGQRYSAFINQDTTEFLLHGPSQTRDLFLATDLAIRTPTIIEPYLSYLSDTLGGAEFLIITDRNLTTSAQAYATYRDTNQVQPLSSRVVYTDEIYDEFGYGSLTPWAIKRFLNYALDHWQVKPRYVLLWGKGRYKTRDPYANWVPTYGYPASDYEFVSPGPGTGAGILPRVPIGRVNVLDNAEGMDYLAKVDAFEHMTSSQPWQGRGVFLGGGATLGEQNAISSANQYWIPTFTGAPFYGQASYYQKPFAQSPDSLPYHDEISQGVGLIQCFGHTTADTSEIPLREPHLYDNAGKPALVVMMGCYGGNFTGINKSFGEEWIASPDRGALAYLATSAAAYLNPLRDFGRILYPELYQQQRGVPIGEVIYATYHSYVDSLIGIQYRNHARQFNLQGDPALIMVPDTSFGGPASVWPGDTDRDQLVSVQDLLPIGLAYGDSGPPRSQASLNWVAQSAGDWGQSLNDTINHKHIDTDGNGLIDAADTLALSLNYSKSYNKTSTGGFTLGATPLQLFHPDSVGEGDTIQIAVWLGDSTSTDSVYGVSFTVAYDAGMTQQGSLKLDLSQSDLGTPGVDLLSFHRHEYVNGEVAVALTRIDHSQVLAQGKLCDISIVIADDIAKKDYGPFWTDLRQGYAVQVTGQALPMDKAVVPIKMHIPPPPLTALRIYPNPARDQLVIEPNGQLIESLSWWDFSGRMVLPGPDRIWQKIQLPLQNLPSGLYLLRYRVAGEWKVEKWVKE